MQAWSQDCSDEFKVTTPPSLSRTYRILSFTSFLPAYGGSSAFTGLARAISGLSDGRVSLRLRCVA